MQDDAVGWDLQHIHRDPGWAVRIYILYTLLAAIYITVRSITLIYALWLRPSKQGDAPEQLAKAALKGKIQANASTQSVATQFEYLVANVDAEIRAMMRCSSVSFIAALVAFTIGLINTFQGASYEKTTGLWAISSGISESLTTAVLGLIVGLGAFFMASAFEHRLARNRAKWNLSYAPSVER